MFLLLGFFFTRSEPGLQNAPVYCKTSEFPGTYGFMHSSLKTISSTHRRKGTISREINAVIDFKNK